MHEALQQEDDGGGKVTLTVGSLFSGIGGIDLGLERAGMEVRWQCEVDLYCLKVLAKHWPAVRRYGDIREVDWDAVERVDVVAGGFPCQPVSVAGKRRAQLDVRWLWPEFARVVRAVRPRFVLVENVPGLLGRGMGDVLGDLAACGYDVEWQSISAAAFGAPHIRERVWIVAYPNGRRAHAESKRQSESQGEIHVGRNGSLWEMAYSEGGRCPQQRGRCAPTTVFEGSVYQPEWRSGWATEPRMGRVADGIPRRVDRLRGLGNAVVPQVVQWIGERIIVAEVPA